MKEIKSGIFWTCKVDWDIKNFHGHEYSTTNGTSYNSYLIKDEKNVLIDTIWYPYKDEFKEDMKDEIEALDAIIINHMEPDHGGSLEAITDLRPDIPVYCTKNGADIIKAHFHKDFNFHIVKTGDTLCTGKYTLKFIEMTMLHWPDSMMTYVEGAKLLISNDAFGQHYATGGLYDDLADQCTLMKEALKYYANILSPFNALVKKKLAALPSLNLDIDMIAPSHGVIWRTNPSKILEAYSQWCEGKGDGSVCVIFNTMYDATRTMAECIAKGLDDEGVPYKIFNVSTIDRSDLITEIFKSSGIILGSCTVGNNPLREAYSLLGDIKTLKMKGKLAASFGSYGWSGEAPDNIFEMLETSGMTMFGKPMKVKYRPDKEVIAELREFGRLFGKAIK